MIEKAINKIVELTKLAGPKSVEINGLTYYGDGNRLELMKPPVIGPIEGSTLLSVCDYVNLCAEKEGVTVGYLIVESPADIKVVISADQTFRRRQYPFTASAIVDRFSYGQNISIDEFIPKVKSMFSDGGDKDELLKFTGNVTAESSVSVEDDGTTQRVQVKKGIARREDVALPQTVVLHPFETFPEIDQPARKFVFRIQKDENTFYCRLIPADGEAWKVPVKEQIAAFLKEKLQQDIPILY